MATYFLVVKAIDIAVHLSRGRSRLEMSTDVTNINVVKFPPRLSSDPFLSTPTMSSTANRPKRTLISSLSRRFQSADPALLCPSSAVLCHLHRGRHSRCLGDPHFLSSGCASTLVTSSSIIIAKRAITHLVYGVFAYVL